MGSDFPIPPTIYVYTILMVLSFLTGVLQIITQKWEAPGVSVLVFSMSYMSFSSIIVMTMFSMQITVK